MNTIRLAVLGLALTLVGTVPIRAEGGTVKLSKIATRYSLNNFASDSTDGGCSITTGTPFPAGKFLAIQDIRCSVGLPPPNDEKFWLLIVDGASCSGTTVLNATFGSVEGLRYSPILPLGTSASLSVRVLRTSSLNAGTFQVTCDIAGTFVKAP